MKILKLGIALVVALILVVSFGGTIVSADGGEDVKVSLSDILIATGPHNLYVGAEVSIHCSATVTSEAWADRWFLWDYAEAYSESNLTITAPDDSVICDETVIMLKPQTFMN